MEMTESHLCLLENLELAERVCRALGELTEFVELTITSRINRLVEQHLGEPWVVERRYWSLWKSDWDGAYFYLQYADEGSDESALAHLLGTSEDGGYQFALYFDDLLKSTGKSRDEIEPLVFKHLGSIAAFKTLQRVANTKRQLSYRRQLRLDRDPLYKAIESNALAKGEGLEPIDRAIQDIKALAPGIDALLKEARGET